MSLYPRISSHSRAFIGGGYSPSLIFPTFNVGAGLYHSFFKKTELEIGVRYLNFQNIEKPIIIYTSSFSLSYKQWWFLARTYLTPKVGSINQSYYLTAKYYMNNPINNIALTLNSGMSEHDYIDPDSGKTFNFPTRSKRIKLAFQHGLFSTKTILKLSSAYEIRNYYQNPSKERISLGIGLERMF
ncbi:MAG: hypothetical protein NVS3B19_09890 [Ginsengibacter sp.]